MSKENNMSTPNDTPIWQQPESEIDALEMQLGRIAGEWRRTEDPKYVKQYHDVYHRLRAMGWDDSIDSEAELPYELMPQDYVDEIRATQARD
jgi:hypothetical protein